MKQEVLYGKSLCDICIKDPFLIKEAIDSYPKQALVSEDSIINYICSNQQARLMILSELGMQDKM